MDLLVFKWKILVFILFNLDQRTYTNHVATYRDHVASWLGVQLNVRTVLIKKLKVLEKMY